MGASHTPSDLLSQAKRLVQVDWASLKKTALASSYLVDEMHIKVLNRHLVMRKLPELPLRLIPVVALCV